MTEARPYASLSSGLLARKGAAKPAMRPQGFTHIEDLGWDDFGVEPFNENEAHEPSSIAALTPAPKSKAIGHDEPVQDAVAQQRALAERLGEPLDRAPRKRRGKTASKECAEIVRLPERSPAPVPALRTKKAAFTLRLDPERHLKLRLACAVNGRSAQQYVTAALDAALANDPQIELLASRVNGAGA